MGDAVSGTVDHVLDHSGQLLGLERQAGYSVVADRVDEEPSADQQGELAEIHLRDDHLVIFAYDIAGIRGERVEVAEVGVGHRQALRADAAARGADGPVGRTPAEDEYPRLARGIVDLQRRNARRDSVDLRLARADHEVVVGRVIGDVAVTVCLFDTADAVLEARSPWDRPRPSESLRITQVG